MDQKMLEIVEFKCRGICFRQLTDALREWRTVDCLVTVAPRRTSYLLHQVEHFGKFRFEL
jgi:hypothetical protein